MSRKVSENTLVLIDGSSFLYRAYYGLKPLHTAKGVPVQAVYGFCRMIKKIIDTFDPYHMVLVWDSKGKTIRHEQFADYKSTRQAPPSDLFDQKKIIQEFADAIGLCQYAQDGIEADDLLYSLAHDWKKQGGSALIVTSDKDMAQAIDDGITLYDSFKDIIIDAKIFEEKMGFPSSKVVFYFALLGDSSDNIPGAKGIGEKSALGLVLQFNSVADMYMQCDHIASKRIKMALEESKDNVLLSEKLFLLQHYFIPLSKQDKVFDKKEWDKAASFFERFDFKSLLRGISGNVISSVVPIHSSEKGYQYVCVTTHEQLQEVVHEIKKTKLFAYDTEGYGLLPLQGEMVGISICCQEKRSYYIPFGHEIKDIQLSKKEVIEILKPLFENELYKKIVHYRKFDDELLARYGIVVSGVVFDTLIAAGLLREEWEKISLKILSVRYLQEPMLTYEQVVTHNKYAHFGYVPLNLATEYAAADAHQTLRLFPILKDLLKEREMESLFYGLEMPLITILQQMEEQGIECDVAVLKNLDETVSAQLQTVRDTIISFVDPSHATINLNSSQQVEELLFQHLQLPPQKKSAKGTRFSTDNEVLNQLAKTHPIPGYIAQYRELFKLKSTYIDALPTYINERTHKIHTQFSQTQVATGRLSSLEPNLQNVPAEGIGLGVRKAFIPGKGNLFLSVDYSQIELRVLAQLSQDPVLKKAFLEGHDIHAQTAAGLFGISLDQVNKHQRSIGKRINFSILYGLTPYGLSKDLDIPLKDAKKYIEAYFNHYPRISEWMKTVIDFTKKHGYAMTLGGRRRIIPGIREKNKHLYDVACRVAVNTVAQGTAAELMKNGMLKVSELLVKKKYEAKLVLQIHDELLLTVAHDQIDEVSLSVKKTLETVVSWDIPLVVAVATGRNWQEVT